MADAVTAETSDRRHDVLRALRFPVPVELGNVGSVAHRFGARRARFAPTPSHMGVYAQLLPNERITHIGPRVNIVL